VASGNITISSDVPAGFTANAFGSIGASVSKPAIAITQGISIGKFLQTQANFALGAAAPNGGLVVTLTSNNTNLVLLSTTPTGTGQQTVTITLSAGQTSGTYYIQGLASSGAATYTVGAPGFVSSTGGITLTPSGIVVGDGINPGAFVLGNTVVVSMAQLDPATNSFVQIQQLAGGMSPVSVAMSTTVSGATITSPVSIAPGTDSISATLTGSGFGTVTAATPAGFTDSNFLTVNIFF
jgi:hypothetical protein